jgi:eukaryotic-like serine/threonine-protein kinase
VSWRGKEKTGTGTRVQAPSGFRDSDRPIFSAGEVVSSAYQIRAPLARVDNGQVFEAWDMVLERTVVLKAGWRDPGTPPLLPEARLPGAIADPCAASVYGVGNYHSVEYVVGERLTGVSLAEQLAAFGESGALVPVHDVLDILCRLARGLEAIHRARTSLRDLTADTVLVAAERRLVFGKLSLSQARAVAVDGVCFAPEIITGGQQAIDPASPGARAVDLYGLGCLAVELLTGRPPYVGDSLKATLFNHVHQRPPALAQSRPDVPVELGDLVSELLSKQPTLRPGSAADVLAQLEAIQERTNASRRTVRVLIVDDDSERVRPLWSVVRRAHARAVVDAARDASDAANKLRRDRPELVIVNVGPSGGAMSGLEVCMYIQNLEEAKGSMVVAVADHMTPGDATLLQQLGVRYALVRDAGLHGAVAMLVKQVAALARPGANATPARTTIAG